MNVFVIGLGLIGGSMALDIQAIYKNAVLYGIDSNEDHVDKALALQIIHKKTSFKELDKASRTTISASFTSARKISSATAFSSFVKSFASK